MKVPNSANNSYAESMGALWEADVKGFRNIFLVITTKLFIKLSNIEAVLLFSLTVDNAYIMTHQQINTFGWTMPIKYDFVL